MGNLWKIPGNGMTLIQGGTPPVLSERWLTKTIGLVCQHIYLINHSEIGVSYAPTQLTNWGTTLYEESMENPWKIYGKSMGFMGENHGKAI